MRCAEIRRDTRGPSDLARHVPRSRLITRDHARCRISQADRKQADASLEKAEDAFDVETAEEAAREKYACERYYSTKVVNPVNDDAKVKGG